MAKHIGNAGKAKIGTYSVAELTAVEISERAAVADSSALADAWDTHIPGSKSWDGSMTCWWDETDTNGQQACVVGASITFGFYPEGDATGSTYKSGTGTIVEVGIAVARNQTIGRTIRVQGNGALSEATVSGS